MAALFLCQGFTRQALSSQSFAIIVKCFLGKSMLSQCLLGIQLSLGILGPALLRCHSLAHAGKHLDIQGQTHRRGYGSKIGRSRARGFGP